LSTAFDGRKSDILVIESGQDDNWQCRVKGMNSVKRIYACTIRQKEVEQNDVNVMLGKAFEGLGQSANPLSVNPQSPQAYAEKLSLRWTVFDHERLDFAVGINRLGT
jgi:hypothetical protein